MSKHTPGPWVSIGDDINSADGVPICEMVLSMNDEQAAMLAADARLIAAAPDLLAALKGILNNPDGRGTVEQWQAGLAAIAKAEGRS